MDKLATFEMGRCCCSTVAKPTTPFVVSTGISSGGDNSSYQPGTPGNPTEVKAIDVIFVVNVPSHTPVTSSVLTEAVA